MNLNTFQAYWLGTEHAALWFPAPGFDTKRVERYFVARSYFHLPLARGEG